MKILMLGWELPPYNSGGLGVACYQLCKNLSARGFDIDFILPYSPRDQPSFMRVHGAIRGLSNPFDLTNLTYSGGDILNSVSPAEAELVGYQQQYEAGALKAINEASFDIVHAHDWLTFRTAIAVKHQTNWPFIAHIHSIESDRAGGNLGNPIVREIEASGLTMADRIIAVSEHTKSGIVEEYHIPAEKVEVIHNALDSSELAELDEINAYTYLTYLKSLGWKVVVNVGRLTIQKGLSNLLRATAEVVRLEPKTMLLIVGNGELYEELLQQAAELGISQHVLMSGFQRGKNWRDAFAIADLFVMPSVSEPFGLATLEALFYDTASLISKQSGVSEVLKNCLKVDYWDVDEMVNQMVNVLRSPALRDDITSNAKAELKERNWQIAVDKLSSLYNRQLTGARL